MTNTSQNSTRLPVLVNLSTNESHPISGQSLTIGRAPGNNLVLENDEFASGSHARIYWQNGWWIEDLQSSNGTAIDGEVIVAPRQLRSGNILKFGRTQFRID